jgi:hypothetical protein
MVRRSGELERQRLGQQRLHDDGGALPLLRANSIEMGDDSSSLCCQRHDHMDIERGG